MEMTSHDVTAFAIFRKIKSLFSNSCIRSIRFNSSYSSFYVVVGNSVVEGTIRQESRIPSPKSPSNKTEVIASVIASPHAAGHYNYENLAGRGLIYKVK